MTLKFELTDQEANLVMAALAKQPFEVVAGLIQKIQRSEERRVGKECS